MAEENARCDGKRNDREAANQSQMEQSDPILGKDGNQNKSADQHHKCNAQGQAEGASHFGRQSKWKLDCQVNERGSKAESVRQPNAASRLNKERDNNKGSNSGGQRRFLFPGF